MVIGSFRKFWNLIPLLEISGPLELFDLKKRWNFHCLNDKISIKSSKTQNQTNHHAGVKNKSRRSFKVVKNLMFGWKEAVSSELESFQLLNLRGDDEIWLFRVYTRNQEESCQRDKIPRLHQKQMEEPVLELLLELFWVQIGRESCCCVETSRCLQGGVVGIHSLCLVANVLAQRIFLAGFLSLKGIEV